MNCIPDFFRVILKKSGFFWLWVGLILASIGSIHWNRKVTLKVPNSFSSIQPKPLTFIFVLLLGLVSLAGCVRSQSINSPLAQPPYRPPTLVPTAQPTAKTETTASSETASNENGGPTCVDSLTFVADATIPDGTEVDPGATVDKRWEVRNNGTCNWDRRYTMRLINGPELGAATEQALFPARSNSSATLRIVFRAPSESGKYRSAWQAFNPDEQPFGDPFFIEIIVK